MVLPTNDINRPSEDSFTNNELRIPTVFDNSDKSTDVETKKSFLLRHWSAQYKAMCIDFYLKRLKCQIIGSEFRYGIAQLITDLIIVTPKNTISIEIKTEQDDLRRILRQATEASKVFNQVIIFISSKHEMEAINILPHNIGITTVLDNCCKIARIPQRNIPLPSELLASIPASFLRSYFNITGCMDSDELRQHILEHNASEMNTCFRKYLVRKYLKNYSQFLSDKGSITHMEDIPILTMKTEIEFK